MPTRTPSAHAATEPTGRAALLLTLVAGVLAAGVAAAGPAAAVDDPTRPDARVTHGPSCRPGGVVVEVVAGTRPYAVTLATTRAPAGEDSVVIQPGERAVLATGDVAWGETIDGYLEYTALDGAGGSHVDDLEGYTFTRPAEEDCAAIIAPAAPATVPMAPPGRDGAAPQVPDGTVVDPDGSDALPAGDDAGDEGTRSGTDVLPPAGASGRAFGDGGQGTTAQGGTIAAAPAVYGQDASPAPVFAAAVALFGAAGGLVAVTGRREFRFRRPARNA